MTLRHPHDCARCGGTIHPGDEFAAVDVLDPDGEIQQLLCPGCARELREFLGDQDGDEYAHGDTRRGGNGIKNEDENQGKGEHEHEHRNGVTESGQDQNDNSV